ncbi:uncharacterized protein Dana_GF20948, isoform B [Drosophila ananassae]|uniref:Uncharacterized protein, isoform A n=1 Tax=Drosophila ananassae TaxID=7217 RepID=B3MRR3_DROAN|nr:RNA-binding protein 4F [Drosophila ananassae]XP_014761001.1 RNA-binding protein 4F [Drosophila ananassae]EDV34468.1 uncharacterized protein Dana_GF20948, isoform A [Drosophila ananassae]KPU75158.1 uncharacterized protein Dana_GF20948, isoform B [Drosophila ananassae]
MDSDGQLEKELERELDEMPVQDLDSDDPDDEFDLMNIEPASSNNKTAIQPEDTIEISSSSEDEEETLQESGEPEASLDIDDRSSDGVMVDSSSESDSDDSDAADRETQLERTFDELHKLPHKSYSQLVKLAEMAFKLNDIERIEKAVALLDSEATVPAHIWLKYLKIILVVTQTSEERKVFEKKCANALKYQYNIPLCEFVVGYLVDKADLKENHVLWAKLLGDYDVERPDFGNSLRTLLKTVKDEKEVSVFQELLKDHCATWECTKEERHVIESHVDGFKRHLEETKSQHTDWDWAKVHSSHVEQVQRSPISENIQNAVIRFVFERCVAKFPTADALWLDYIRFMQDGDESKDLDEDQDALERLKLRLGRGHLSNEALELAKRGVKCRPSVRLNHRYLHLMERADFEQKQVDLEVEALLKRIVPEMDMTVELHLDYLAYRVRNTNVADKEQTASLRDAFQKAWIELSSWYGDLADTRYEIMQLWAQVEYTHLASPANGALIWRQILGYPGSSHRGLLWLSFAQMESEYNSGQGTRDILREALNQPALEDGLMVQELLRRYERCYGTYESIAACQAIELPNEFPIRARRKPIQQQQQPQQQKNTNPRHQPQQQKNTNPRQQQERNAPQQRQQKQQPPKASEQTTFVAPRPVVSAAVAAKPTPQPTSLSEPREAHFKYSTQLETNKIFVRNLYPACTKEELQELFSPFGNIKDVRLVHKLNKQLKGIAYVEFELPAEAQKAVAGRDGCLLGGLKISVAISNPPPKNNPPPSQKWTSSSSDSAKAKVAPKRRMPTTLIPTSLVRKEVAEKKRRLDENAGTEGQEPAGAGPNGKIADSGKDKEEPGASKSNEDFRKLLNL